jgi:hypothetical protein
MNDWVRDIRRINRRAFQADWTLGARNACEISGIQLHHFSAIRITIRCERHRCRHFDRRNIIPGGRHHFVVTRTTIPTPRETAGWIFIAAGDERVIVVVHLLLNDILSCATDFDSENQNELSSEAAFRFLERAPDPPLPCWPTQTL